MGAPLGNTNAVKAGSRTKRHGLVLAELGRKHAAIYRHLIQLRRGLERLVADSQGNVSIEATALVNEAVRWEMTARVTGRMIAEKPDLAPTDVVSFLNTIGNATRQRNAIIAKLAKHKPEASDALTSLLAGRMAENVSEANHGQETAPDEASGNVEASL